MSAVLAIVFTVSATLKNVYDDDDDDDDARHSRQDGHVERRQWHANYCRKTVVS